MNFKNPERVMQVQHYHPGHSVDEIKENTGFDIGVAADVSETATPGSDVIKLINAMDPDGVRGSEFH
jgi:hypothetical protein